LQAIAGPAMNPDIAAEELLERAWRNVIEQGDRFHAFALQIAELPAHVVFEMLPRFEPT
jgi:hypothetical protein